MKRRFEIVEISCRGVLVLVFLAAGLPKLVNIDDFATTISAYGLVPDSLLGPAALVLVVLELAAAVGLVWRKKWALHLTAFLLVLFVSVLFYGLRLGLDIDCGCFGPDEAGIEPFSSLRLALYRDLALLIPVIILYFQTMRGKIQQKGAMR